MNKGDLVNKISEEGEISNAAATRCLDTMIECITGELQNGGQVTIPGFGTFSVSMRSARTGRNPQTGEPIEIKAARVAKFKAGKGLKEAVSQTD